MKAKMKTNTKRQNRTNKHKKGKRATSNKVKRVRFRISKLHNTKTKKINRKETPFHLSGGLDKVKCSPKEKDKINGFTCYTTASLIKMKDLWNLRHPDSKISATDPKQVHRELEQHMSKVCNKESCWLKQHFVSGKIDGEMLGAFAPVAPKEWKKNPNEWLSSVDITNVMKQYEKAYKCFEFIGPTPIDFDSKMYNGQCVWNELCHFSIHEQIKKGKTKIGIIFNTDPHTEGGQHWISMFINIKKKQIFFFDSAGDKVPSEIKRFADRVIEQGKKLDEPIHFHFDQNYPVEHQYGNTECGVYSLYFIIYMLEDKISGHYLKTHIIPDEYVNKYRHIFFNDEL